MIAKCLKKIIQQLLLIFCILKKKILPAFISNHNSTSEKIIILLIILKKEKEVEHYLAVKKLSTLLKGITWKHRETFYCLNCLHFFRIENKLKSYEKVCKNKDFCRTLISTDRKE